jgi:shikimate dehydrogenase
MIRASVIGWPISHSRSPLIHGYWLRKYGIAGSYEKQAVSPDELQTFIHSLRHGPHVGTNVTLPHKETAVSCVDEPDERARRIGALNTIWRQNGKLHASSTDGPGFYANLRQTLPHFQLAEKPAVILGAGGSARAIIDELLRQGVDRIYIQNRTPARAQALADHFGKMIIPTSPTELPQALSEANLLINTTSSGITGEATPDFPWNHLHKDAAVTDIVYTPLITEFLGMAKARDHAIVTGLGMLLHQAVFGFEKWFGIKPQVTAELHDLVARDIDPGYNG